jgi:ketosteroid isomerase-like protein
MQSEDLGTFFLERANAGDVEGLVALYEPEAVLAFPPGRLATGHEEIRNDRRTGARGTGASRPGLRSVTPGL